jgi:hypothetical protein
VLNFKEHVTFVRKSLEAIEAEKKTQDTKPQAEGEAQPPPEVVLEAAT